MSGSSFCLPRRRSVLLFRYVGPIFATVFEKVCNYHEQIRTIRNRVQSAGGRDVRRREGGISLARGRCPAPSSRPAATDNTAPRLDVLFSRERREHDRRGIGRRRHHSGGSQSRCRRRPHSRMLHRRRIHRKAHPPRKRRDTPAEKRERSASPPKKKNPRRYR